MRASLWNSGRRWAAAGGHLAVVTLLVAGIAGCGGDRESDPPALSANEKAELTGLIEQVRSATEAEDGAGTRRALSALEQRINLLKEADRLSLTQATSLLAAVDQAQARANEELPPVAEIAPPEPLPSAGEADGEEDKERDGDEEGEDD